MSQEELSCELHVKEEICYIFDVLFKDFILSKWQGIELLKAKMLLRFHGDSRDNQVTSEYHENEGSTCKPVRKSGRSAAQKARDRIMALHLSEEDEENCC